MNKWAGEDLNLTHRCPQGFPNRKNNTDKWRREEEVVLLGKEKKVEEVGEEEKEKEKEEEEEEEEEREEEEEKEKEEKYVVNDEDGDGDGDIRNEIRL